MKEYDDPVYCTHRRFMSTMCQFRNKLPIEKVFGMKRSEFFMLSNIESDIRKNGSTKVSDIAKRMKMTSAAASKTIGELEDKGLIVKKVNKDDKRQAYIELTESGTKELDEIKKTAISFSDAVIQKFGKENADKMMELIEQFYNITAEEIDKFTKK